MFRAGRFTGANWLIKGERVNDGALQLIEKFLGRLPNKPTVLQIRQVDL